MNGPEGTIRWALPPRQTSPVSPATSAAQLRANAAHEALDGLVAASVDLTTERDEASAQATEEYVRLRTEFEAACEGEKKQRLRTKAAEARVRELESERDEAEECVTQAQQDINALRAQRDAARAERDEAREHSRGNYAKARTEALRAEAAEARVRAVEADLQQAGNMPGRIAKRHGWINKAEAEELQSRVRLLAEALSEIGGLCDEWGHQHLSGLLGLIASKARAALAGSATSSETPTLRDAEFRARVREAHAALMRGDGATVEYLRGGGIYPIESSVRILDDTEEWTREDAKVVAHAYALLVASVGQAAAVAPGQIV